MAEEIYQTIFEYRADGIARTEQEINDLARSIKDAGDAEELTEKQLKSFTNQVAALGASVKEQRRHLDLMGQGFADLVQQAARANKEFKELSASDAMAGGPVQKFDNIQNWNDTQLRQYIATQDALTLTVEGTARQYLGLKKNIAETYRGMEVSDARYALEQQLVGVDELKAAYDRLAAAKHEREYAQMNLDTAPNIQAEAEALTGLAAANDRVHAAELRVSQVRQQRSDEANAQVLKREAEQAKAYEKSLEAVTRAEQKRENVAARGFTASKQASDQAQAVLKVAMAEERAAKATRDRVAADSGSNIEQKTAANHQYAQAVNRRAEAEATANRVAEETVDRMPRLRYALYDVSQVATLAGTALTGLALAGTAVGIGMDRAFADVTRTTEVYMDSTGAAARRLRDDFDDLYTSMPASWDSLTEIGTLAGQLNIASEDVTRFTELVQQFATTTDVSVEASATAFGRLSTLLKVPAEEYQNLGSSILAVGVNSVATESQIIAISQNIAGIAVSAGLSADQVFGLSSALASLGTPPELSRGIVTRLFTNIMTSVSEGGEALQKFGAYAGMSAEAFAKAWGEDATGALYQLMRGIGNLESDKALQALTDLGIKQVRDIPAVLRLAQNYDILGDSLAIAAQGYAEGTLLSEHYGVVADTVASKLVILKNSLQLLLSELSIGEDIIRFVVESLTDLANGLRALVKVPVVGELTQFVLILGAIAGPLLILIGLVARGVASYQALRQVAIETGTAMGVYSQATNHAGKATHLLVGEVTKATIATQAFQRVLRSSLVFAGVTALIWALERVTGGLDAAWSGANKLKIEMDDLLPAMQRDAQAVADGVADYDTFVVKLEEAEGGSRGMSDALREIWGVAPDAAKGVDEVTDSVKNLTLAIGENTIAQMASDLANDDAFRELLSDYETVLSEVGFTVKDYVGALASGEGEAYIEGLRQQVQSMRAEIEAEIARLEQERARQRELRWGGSPGALSDEEFEQMNAEFDALVARLDALGELEPFTKLSAQAETFSAELQEMVLTGEITRAVMEGFGIAASDLGGDFDDLGDAVGGANQSLWDYLDLIGEGPGKIHEFEAGMDNFISKVVENGATLSAYSKEGRENFSALKTVLDQLWQDSGQNAQIFGANLVNVFAQVEGAGIELGEEVDYLREIMVTSFNQTYGLNLDTTAARGSIKAFIEAAIAAIRVRAELERQTIQAAPTFLPGAAGAAAAALAKKQADERARQNELQIAQLESIGKAADQHVRQGAANSFRAMDDAAKRAGKSAKKSANKAKEAAKEIYTLVDYASDLEKVWGRAFGLRFSVEISGDKVADQWHGIAEAFADAEDSVRDLRKELRSLNADLGTLQADLSQQQYFLSIALEYGDAHRAEQIQARIGELQAELAKKQDEVTDTTKELGKAQQSASRDLTGTSEAARENRADVLGLVQAYQDQIGKMAETGMSTADLQRETERLRAEFIQQGTQLGYSRADLEKYARAFDDVTYAIKNVPRSITVTAHANMNPAELAMQEWLARRRTTTVQATVTSPGSLSGGEFRPSSISTPGTLWANSIGTTSLSATNTYTRNYQQGVGPTGSIRASDGMIVPKYLASGSVLGLHPGAPRGTDTVPAWLTPGEAVTQRPAVRYYGADFFNALNEMKVPRHFARGWNSGGGAGASGFNGVVTLSAITIQQIAYAVRPHLYLDGKQVAQAASRANAFGTDTGSN